MDNGGILTTLSTLGAGGLIGVLIKIFFDSRHQKKKMLFEARVRAYAGITGRINNHFLESDINRDSESVRFSQINSILSETYLLSGSQLRCLLDKYIIEVNEFHCLLLCGKKEKSEIDSKTAFLAKLVIEINEEMRKDLYL
jgi:hypothetical protein